LNIRAQLLFEHSKKNALLISNYIIQYPSKLEELIYLFLKKEPIVSQRAALSISAYFDLNKENLMPFINRFIPVLGEDGHHVAIKRSILRILQSLEIPEEHAASLIDNCIQFIQNPKEPIAVKVFSMNILKKFCQYHPELEVEVIPLIEDLIDREPSAGILSCGKKVLKTLYS
jgi:hypothetical protein